MDFIKKLNVDKVRNLAEDAINQARPKTDMEAKIYEVLSHKNWGSSSTQMNEIASDSFDYDKFSVIAKLIWEALENQRPAAWRVVFKGLTLLEHLIKNGSERCVDDGRNHSHVLRSLYNFNYYEGTVDRGVGVREKAKQLVELLGDDERIREERTKAKQLREKFGGKLGGHTNTNRNEGGGYGGYGNDRNDTYNGSSGYGDSGIGSNGSTGGFNSTGGFGSNNPDRGYSGRYSDTNENSSGNVSTPVESSEADVPTFAALPEKKKKTKKTKKKKDKSLKVPLPPPASDEPATDLFANPSTENDLFANPSTENNPAVFDAFGQNDSAPSVSNPASQATTFDAFGSSAPTTTQPTFDAFSSSAPTPQPQPTFDAFSQPTPQTQPAFNAFGNSNSVSNPAGANSGMNTMTDMFGNMNPGNNSSINNMQQQQQNTASSNSNIMGGNRGADFKKASSNISAEADDFGDFEGANKNFSAPVDPISKLISLDGLSKNKMGPTEAEQKANTTSAISASIAFEGVDGLNRVPTSFAAKNQTNNRLSSQPVMTSNVQANAGGVYNQGQQGMMGNSQQGMMGMMGNSQQGMMGNSQQGMMGNSQQGMMGNFQQGMMGATQQGMMGNVGMGQQGVQAGMGQQGGQLGQQMMGQGGNMAGSFNMSGGMASTGQQSANMMGGNGMGNNQGVNMMGVNGMGMNQPGGNMMGGQTTSGW